MNDNWEDWESDNFVIPDLSLKNSEQLKELAERKLVEESDNEITRDLFQLKIPEDLNEIKENIVIYELDIKKKDKETDKKKNKISKQKDNELKQKEFSKKNKDEKLKKQKFSELFGEAECCYEYDEYEEKFYN